MNKTFILFYSMILVISIKQHSLSDSDIIFQEVSTQNSVKNTQLTKNKNYYFPQDLQRDLFLSNKDKLRISEEEQTIPDILDWRQKQIITPVKDQGKCWSQWAFSAAAQFQSIYFERYGKTIDFSQQYLMGCSNNYGFSGTCLGGVFTQSLVFMNNTKKIALEETVPYTMSGYSKQQTPTVDCQNVALESFSDLKFNYTIMTNLSSSALITQINKFPLLSSIRFFEQLFSNYTGGIITCEPVDPTDNHYYDVQVVGYNKIQKYYIIKNSMGTSWGQQGFARISMDENSDCGIRRFIAVVDFQKSQTYMLFSLTTFILFLIS